MGLSDREMVMIARMRNEASGELQRINRDIKATGLSGNDASLRLFAYSNAFEQVGRSMTRFGMITLALAGFSIKLANDFEAGLALVRTQTKMTDQEFENLKTTILDMSVATGRSTEELAEGLYDILSSLFVTVPEATQMLEQMAKAAVAGGTDIRTVARSAIAELNAFGLSASDLGRVLDLQFGLVRVGIGTYEEFANAIGKLTPSAVSAGQSVDSMSGVLAFATKGGLSAAEAVTSLARAYDLFTRPQVRENFENVLGIDIVNKATGEYKQLDRIIFEMATKGGLAELSKPELKNTFKDLFGQGEIRALRFFNLAIPNFRDLARVVQEVAGPGSVGAMLDAFQTMANTGQFATDQLLAAGKALAIQFGQSLTPIVKELASSLEGVFDWYKNLSGGTQDLIARTTVFIGVVSLLGGIVLTTAGRFLRLISIFRLAGISMAGPAGAIAGIIVGVTLLIGLFGKLVGEGDGLISTMGGLALKLGLVVGAFMVFKNLLFIPILLVNIGKAMKTMGMAAAGAAVMNRGLNLALTSMAGPLAVVAAGVTLAVMAHRDLVAQNQASANSIRENLIPALEEGANMGMTFAEVLSSLGVKNAEEFRGKMNLASDAASGFDLTLFELQSTFMQTAGQMHLNAIRGGTVAETQHQMAAATRATNDAMREQYLLGLQLAGGFLGIQGAILQAKDSQFALRDAQVAANEALSEHGPKSKEYRRALHGIDKAQLQVLTSQAALTEEVFSYLEEQGKADATTKEVAQTVREFGRRAGLTKGEINGLVRSVKDQIREEKTLADQDPVTVHHKTPGLSEAIANARTLNGLLDLIDNRNVAATIQLRRVNLPVVEGAMGFHGVVNSPTMFLAGEAGREQVDITPMPRGQRQIADDSQEGRVVNINIDATKTKDAEEIAREIDWYYRTAGW